MNEDHAVEIAEVFRLLGDPTRLRVILACLDQAKAVNDIAAEVGISQSLTSHHLRLLRSARLVRADRQGRQVYYATADDHVRCILVDMVDHVAEEDPVDEENMETV